MFLFFRLLIVPFKARLGNFMCLEGPNGCLDNVWFRFDKDRTGFMTKKEFRYLLFVALSLFCRARDPTINHSKKTMEPFILKLQQDLVRFFHQNVQLFSKKHLFHPKIEQNFLSHVFLASKN